MTRNDTVRIEHDLLGEEAVPADAYYGIQTLRAVRNFNISGVPINHFPELINALAQVKWAAAETNLELGLLPEAKAKAIQTACTDIMAGGLHDQFPVDLIQGGAGTSTNMNANEVIANRALEHLGRAKGEYQYLHPNNDVNMSQSTNDVYPTAARLALIIADDPLIESIWELRAALNTKRAEFVDVLKVGRTQLQDAVPMTLAQEFQGWAVTLGEDIDRMDEIARLFSEINLGGTAIGTGINTHPQYAGMVVDRLSEISGISFTLAPSLVEATSDMGAFVLFSSMLKRLAVKISKICNDLRLLSSGPRTGLNEINLPPMQPGSSIMPGKVNPVIPEAVNQTAFQIIGNDLAVTMAAEAGQLQLNAFEPLIVYNLLNSLRMMTNAIKMLTTRCIEGITVNREHCERTVRDSVGVVTAFSPHIGYENAARLAQKALQENSSVVDLIEQENLLSAERIQAIMQASNLTGPSSLLGEVPIEDIDRSHTHVIDDEKERER